MASDQTTRNRKAAGVALVAAAGVILSGVASAKPSSSQEELREETLAYLDAFSNLVSRTADQIGDESTDPRIRKRALLWKLHMIPYAQDAAFLDDPRDAYGASLAVAISQRIYLTEGDGRDIFAEHQAEAVKAARDAEVLIRTIGSSFLSEKAAARLDTQTEALVRRRPIVGRDFSVPAVAPTRTHADEGGVAWLLQVPMAPFKALSGVSDGAAAIREFNDTAIRFAAVVEGLPEQIRWQTELLVFDLETSAAIRRSLEAAESLSVSASVASEAMARLPADLEAMLARSDGTLAEVNVTLTQARELMVPLQSAIANFRDAGLAWNEVIHGGDGAAAAADAAPTGRPFDIREWEGPLKETSVAAIELRKLAVELRELGGSLEAEESTIGVLRAADRVESGARDVVDHAAWRSFQVGLALFGLFVVYRLLSWWLGRKVAPTA